ncbi:hypothetical protein L0222_19185 [bacterium]|nr:hypothetical protein [bacterium]
METSTETADGLPVAVARKRKLLQIWGIAASAIVVGLSVALLFAFKRSPAPISSSPLSYHRLSYRQGLRYFGKIRSRWFQRFPYAKLHDIGPQGQLLLSFEGERGTVAGLLYGEMKERDLSWLDNSFLMDLSEDGKTILIFESGEGGEAPWGTTYIRKTDGSPAVG